MGRRRLVQVAAAASAVFTAFLLFSPLASATLASPEAAMCGGANKNVVADFEIASTKDIWSVFPAMLQAPELAENNGPAHVVVFSGDFDLDGMVVGNGVDRAPIVQDVVCVIPENDRPHIYHDVSRAGTAWQ